VRRIAAIALAALLGLVTLLVSSAGADDTREYEIEMFNAFGVVDGSDVRVAGVNAGTVTDIDVNELKRAVVTVELSGPFAELGDETTCASQPGSLIAEYFIDCDPAGAPLAPDDDADADIPAERVKQTVQIDTLLNTLREPYVERVRLIVDELGTAMAGNSDSLAAALDRAVPALSELEDTTAILARERRAIAALNVDAERVITELADGRENVGRAIDEARETAVVAASRRDDLARGAELLDDTVVALRPTLARLGDVAREGQPVLAELRAAAPSLARLGILLPPFSDRAGDALESLTPTAQTGLRTLRQGDDEVATLAKSSRNAPVVSEILADFLADLNDPDRSVEADLRASRQCDDPDATCWGTGREAPTGFTGLEAILNYIYYQSGAINQFDSVGHLLQFNVYGIATGPCDLFNPGPNVPAAGGGRTTNILEADPCVSWVGKNQADINYDLGLPRYDNSVCVHGSTNLELCDPSISTDPVDQAPWDTGGPVTAAARGDGGFEASPPGASPPARTESGDSDLLNYLMGS